MYWHVAKEISFKDIPILALVAKLNILIYFGHHEEHFYEINLNLDMWFRRCRLKIFLIKGSVGLFCSVQPNHLCNFGGGHYEKHF